MSEPDPFLMPWCYHTSWGKLGKNNLEKRLGAKNDGSGHAKLKTVIM